MSGKVSARIGAAVFVGIAAAMTLVQLREEPGAVAKPARAVWVPDGDPLAGQLRVCAEMGELALASSDCRGAWAEKRRRFFGVDHPDAYQSLEAAAPDGAPGVH